MPISTARGPGTPLRSAPVVKPGFLISENGLSILERAADRSYRQLCCLGSFLAGATFGVVAGVAGAVSGTH